MTSQFGKDEFTGREAGLSIPANFEAIAERYPNLDAIRSPMRTVRYKELKEKSRRLANLFIHKLGTEPRAVALLMEDGIDVITCLLGVVQAGHFYCALSAQDPPARLEMVLQDLEVKLLVTDERYLSLMQKIAPPGCELLLFTELPEIYEMQLPATFDPETLLGIFYTSGSTGEPKGVIRTHSFVLHRLWVDVRDHAICAGDQLLFLRQFNVSASLGIMFDALLTGATLVLYDAGALGISLLTDTLRNERISIFSPPIELLRQFMDSLDDNIRFNSIRSVILGGDVLYRRDVEKLWCHISDKAEIDHHLSSSESGLIARTILHSDSAIAGDIVPVGFPVPEKEVLILGQDGKLLRAGMPGEIAIRSEIIFPGYWRKPELTASRFRSDPIDPSRKVFCTGDLGYFLPDGQLVFLGRNDFKVKIRGYSVDLASVECALMAEPRIKRAVVMPQADPAGNKRLVAYVVSYAPSIISSANLRAFLLERIPAFMVPSAFVFLPDLPLTPAMKVDRKALEPPDWSQLNTSLQYVAPRDEVEQRLATLWQRVLGVDRVGIADSFFDIGGDSILALSIFSEIDKAFGVRLPLATLFDHESISRLAPLIRDPDSLNLAMLVPLSTRGNGLPVFLVPFGNGDVLGLLPLVHLLEGLQPVYGLQAAGVGGKNLYKQEVEQIAKEFVRAIRTIQPFGPYRIIGGSFGGIVAYEMALSLMEAGESVELLGLIDTSPPGPRPSPNLRNRLRIQSQNLRSLQPNQYPKYALNWLRTHLIQLTRRSFFRKLLPFEVLDSIQGDADILHPGRVAHSYYAPRCYYGDVVIFKVKDRPWYVNWDVMAGWTKYIKGKITVAEVEGTHGKVYSDPYVAGLANAIKTFL